jgi:hypothetical protein
MALSQESIERWFVVFRELGFRRFPHDAVVSDDSESVERPLLDQLSAYPPQKKANKWVEDNGRGGELREGHFAPSLLANAKTRVTFPGSTVMATGFSPIKPPPA